MLIKSWLIAGVKLRSGFYLSTALALLVRIIPKPAMLLNVIVLAREQFKITNRVIQLVAIFVMDDFRWQKFPANMLRHHLPMLKASFSVSEGHPIPIWKHAAAFICLIAVPSECKPPACVGAKPLPSMLRRTSGWRKCVTAMFACLSFHGRKYICRLHQKPLAIEV
jgi:hypothetical protein